MMNVKHGMVKNEITHLTLQTYPFPFIKYTKTLYSPRHVNLLPRDACMTSDLRRSRDPRRLALQNVTKEDDGRYTCLATNEAGTIEQDFTLRVMGTVVTLHSRRLCVFFLSSDG